MTKKEYLLIFFHKERKDYNYAWFETEEGLKKYIEYMEEKITVLDAIFIKTCEEIDL